MARDIVTQRHYLGEWKAKHVPWSIFCDLLIDRVSCVVRAGQRFRVVVEILEKEKKKPTPQGPDKGAK